MVASKLTKYLKDTDKNGCVIGSWASESALPGVAKCSFCESVVRFKGGKTPLTSHSETQKHISNVKKTKHSSSQQQLNIDASFSNAEAKSAETKAIEAKAREFEIALSRSLSHHKISFEFVNCLSEHLTKYCGDSVVVNKMQLKRTKAEYYVKNGIGKTYAEETIKLLQTCVGFSIGFDESEVNKTSELEILVKLSNKSGVHMRHYKTIDLESGKAEVIVRTLLDQFDEDCIDYKQKLISSMTDGCNTMQGRISGVKVQLKKEIHQFVDFGSCNDHHISNAMKYGVRAFDPDVEHVVVDMYQDLGGAKGKGLKKKKDFEKICKSIGLKPSAFKQYGSTRFRSIRQCLIPIIGNWDGIIKYYSTLKKLTERQERLKAYFVEREYSSLMNLHFIVAAIRDLIEGIDYYEMDKVLLHESRRKMEELLRNQVTKFHCETAVKMLHDDGENTVLKPGPMLLEIDLANEDTLLNNKRVFVGEQVTSLMKALGVTPKSPQMKMFFSKVQLFYKTLAAKLIEYFSTGLRSTELEYMSAFSPVNSHKVGTTHKMMYLAKRFSKIVSNIAPQGGLDLISDEVRAYTCDDDVKSLSSKSYEEFWIAVSELIEGESSWPRYPVLSRFALAMATAFHANSDTERAFSVQTDIHRNPKKNAMSQHMLDSHMQVHYGVNQKSNIDSCPTCSSHKSNGTHIPRHCHCCVAAIPEEMVKNCTNAWREHKNPTNVPDDVGEPDQALAEKTKEDRVKRRLKFAGTLKTRLLLYPDALTKRVYEDKKKKVPCKEKKKAKKSPLTTTPEVKKSAEEKSRNKRKVDTPREEFTLFPPKAPKKKRNLGKK